MNFWLKQDDIPDNYYSFLDALVDGFGDELGKKPGPLKMTTDCGEFIQINLEEIYDFMVLHDNHECDREVLGAISQTIKDQLWNGCDPICLNRKGLEAALKVISSILIQNCLRKIR
ncbi:MAG: hypothetical protein KGZ39_05570 [Simkania sp.]|nr:hypothetical protein [Simkania sp.]